MPVDPSLHSWKWLRIGLCCSLFSTALLLEAAPKKSGPEALVPAQMQPIQDDKGTQWSVNNYGFLQSTGNTFFNNILMLHVAGQQFYNYQPLMTSDGKEYVLPGQQPMVGLQITRRIRLLEKDGIMRYVDLFHNPGSAAVNTQVEYRNNFSNPVKTSMTDRGAANPAVLGRNETSLLIFSKQQGQKSVLFTLCGAQSKLKPAFTRRQQYEVTFSYPLSVPPGQTVALSYAVQQINAPSETDKPALDKLFKTATSTRFLKSLRSEDAQNVANFAQGASSGPSALLAGQGIESLEVERAKSDVLALGEKTRLLGTASCAEFSVTTDYGAATVPFEQVAALAGPPRAGGLARVFLRDGQIFSGTVKAGDFRFAMPSGARVDLELATLDRLVRSATPDDGKWDPQTAAVLYTYRGETLAIASGAPAIFLATTPWGTVKFSLDDLLWFGPSDDSPVGQQIELKDGSRFYGYLSGDPVTLSTRLFGGKTFGPPQIRGLITAAAMARVKEENGRAGTAKPAPVATVASAEPGQPQVVLAGGQRLPGQIDAAMLTVLTGSKTIEIPPQGIRHLRNAADDGDEPDVGENPPFSIELWGGSTIVGQIKDPVIPLRVRDSVWRVPAADLMEWHTPSPRLSDDTRAQIAAHLRELGSDDWQRREAASQALGELSYMARPMLEETLRSTPDPEVKRRVEKLLDDLE